MFVFLLSKFFSLIIFISVYFPFFMRCACMLRVQTHLSACEHTWLLALGALCACACDVDVFFFNIIIILVFFVVVRLFWFYLFIFLFLRFVHVRAVRVYSTHERTCLRPSIRA